MSKSFRPELLFYTLTTSAWTLAKAFASPIILSRRLILSLPFRESAMSKDSEYSCQELETGHLNSSTTLLLASGSKAHLFLVSCASLSCSRKSLSLRPAPALAPVSHSWRVAPNTPCMYSGWVPTLENPTAKLSSIQFSQQTLAHASSIPPRQAGVTFSDWFTPDMLSPNRKPLSSSPTLLSPDRLSAVLSAVVFQCLAPFSTPEERSGYNADHDYCWVAACRKSWVKGATVILTVVL